MAFATPAMLAPDQARPPPPGRQEAAVSAPNQLLPELGVDDLARLTASIRENGVQVPVVLDEFGVVIDGHHRARIAESLGVDYPKDVRRGLSEAEKRVLAVELNSVRRHLTDAQRVELGRKIEPDIAEIARARQIALAGTRPGEDPTLAANAAKVSGRTSDEVARTVGLGSGDTYERGKKVMEEVEELAPELLPKAQSGEMKLAYFRREMQKRRPQALASVRQESRGRRSARGTYKRLGDYITKEQNALRTLRDIRESCGLTPLLGPQGMELARDLAEVAAAMLDEATAYIAEAEDARARVSQVVSQTIMTPGARLRKEGL